MGKRYYRKPYRSDQYQRGDSFPRYRRRMSLRDMAFLAFFGFLTIMWLGNWLRGENSESQALGLTSATSQNVYYRYCSDARRAGAAPIYRGQPGYRSELDRDNDGVACEPYYGRE